MTSTSVEQRKNPGAVVNHPTATAPNPASSGERQVTLTVTELQNLLQSTAQRGPTSTSGSSAQQPQTSSQPQGTHQSAPPGTMGAIRCDNCGKNGHPASRCWGKRSRNRGQRRRDRSEIDCYICSQLGHCWYECPEYKTGAKKGALEALLGNGPQVSTAVVRQLFSNQNKGNSGASKSRGQGDSAMGSQDLRTSPTMGGESQSK